MDFEFYPPAEDEYHLAVSHYDEIRPELGDRFVHEIEATIVRICRHPLAWRKISRHARRCLARTFPYGIIYVVEQQRIIILAVMHLARRPGYWKGRLREVRRKKAG